MLVGIKKSCRIFPIKQKFNNSAAFFYTKKFLCRTKLNSFCKFATQRATQHQSAQWTQSPRIDFDNLKLLNISKSCRGIKFLFNWKNSP